MATSPRVLCACAVWSRVLEADSVSVAAALYFQAVVDAWPDAHEDKSCCCVVLYLLLCICCCALKSCPQSHASVSNLTHVPSQMGNAMVSLRRLSQYLVMEERRDTVQPLDRVGLDIEGGQFYWCEPPKTKKLDSVKGAPGQGKKRSLLSVFGGLKLRKGPAVGTGPAKDSGMQHHATLGTVHDTNKNAFQLMMG